MCLFCADSSSATSCCGSSVEEHHFHTGALWQLHRAAGEAPSKHLQVRAAITVEASYLKYLLSPPLSAYWCNSNVAAEDVVTITCVCLGLTCLNVRHRHVVKHTCLVQPEQLKFVSSTELKTCFEQFRGSTTQMLQSFVDFLFFSSSLLSSCIAGT